MNNVGMVAMEVLLAHNIRRILPYRQTATLQRTVQQTATLIKLAFNCGDFHRGRGCSKLRQAIVNLVVVAFVGDDRTAPQPQEPVFRSLIPSLLFPCHTGDKKLVASNSYRLSQMRHRFSLSIVADETVSHCKKLIEIALQRKNALALKIKESLSPSHLN
jgi:hypothetical protein